jgi:fibronectin type 3 domain-containing protein
LIVASRDNYIDPDIESGKKYFYYIIATDSSNNQSQSSNILIGFNNFNSLSTGPKDFKVKYREEKKDIYISWKQENIKEMLGFVLYRKESDKAQMIPMTHQSGSNVFLDKNIKAGGTYYYEVRAYEKSGSITKSETIKISIK